MALIVTRFAPSPTGHLHVGGARSALFCWAYARRARLEGGHDGRFMIRIEDTDQARSSDESARGILEDLAWLGIEWDDGPELKAGDTRAIGGDSRAVGPYFQARRTAIYNRYVDQLIAAGRAYPAFEKPEQLDALRKEAAARKQTFRYDRSVMPMDERLRRLRAGEPHAVRLVAPTDVLTVHDQVLGDVTYAAGEMDDFVIRKADGFPTYHFAVVIDDELMGVTHVMRAQEHLNNTPRHVALQRALVRNAADATPDCPAGTPFHTPVYAHMPLIFNMDGTKMSKRDKAKAARNAVKKALGDDKSLTIASLAARMPTHEEVPIPGWTTANGGVRGQFAAFVAGEVDYIEVAEAIGRVLKLQLPEIEVCDFRAAGYLPEALVNFLGLLGWSPGMKDEQGKDVEKFGMDFLARHFAIDRIGRTNAKFDRVKLLSFNADYIGALSDAEFVRRWRIWCAEFQPDVNARLDESRILMLAGAIKPRARTLRDAAKAVEFALTPDDAIVYDPKAVEKALKNGVPSGLSLLPALREAIAGVSPFEPAAINAAVERFAANRSLGMGAAAQPLRVAITGSTVSPPLGETLAVLGRDSALRRIDRCLKTIVA
ncbi:MAG: glutamate--tRNA ligase [Phycisphaerales bacterium]